MTFELEPCPWCRHEQPVLSDNGRGLIFNVHCANDACRATGPWERCAIDAVSTWNALDREGTPADPALLREAHDWILDAVQEGSILEPPRGLVKRLAALSRERDRAS